MLKVIDLFSGIGGFTLGLERTGGFKTVLFCEIDSFCQGVLKRHWPNIYIHPDIRTLGRKNIEVFTPKPDLICGGFPCQDISVAGKKQGLRGKRSGLWWEMFRIICECKPTWLLIENVPNLRAKGADEVLAALEAEGYSCWPAVVGAWALGTPHNRDRAWILGHADHHGFPAPAFQASARKAVFDGREVQARDLTRTGASALLPQVPLARCGKDRQCLPLGLYGNQLQGVPARTGDRWPSGCFGRQRPWEAPRTLEPGLGGAADMGYPAGYTGSGP